MNVAISDKNKLIWVLIPKTGTESVKASSVFKDQRTTWLESRQMASYEQYYKVCVVRNPWDRLVSCYLNKRDTICKDFPTFESFVWWLECKNTKDEKDIPNVVKDRHWTPQHKLVDLKVLDKLIKFDYLPHGFRDVCDYLGVASTLPVLNKVLDKKPYRTYYDRHTRDVVADLYREDCDLFGFDF